MSRQRRVRDRRGTMTKAIRVDAGGALFGFCVPPLLNPYYLGRPKRLVESDQSGGTVSRTLPALDGLCRIKGWWMISTCELIEVLRFVALRRIPW